MTLSGFNYSFIKFVITIANDYDKEEDPNDEATHYECSESVITVDNVHYDPHYLSE